MRCLLALSLVMLMGLVSCQTNSTTTTSNRSIVKGKVLVNAMNGCIVISSGERDGVKVGDIFKVYRNDKYIAMLIVVKVEDIYSAAVASKDSQDDLVLEQDDVIRDSQQKSDNTTPNPENK